MKVSKGGYRASCFELIEAPQRGDYVDRSLWVVDGFPGVWRRCKMPKGDPADSGLLPCWFDGAIIYLEHCGAIGEELKHATAEFADPQEAIRVQTLMTELSEKRTDFLIRERNAKPDPAAAKPAQNHIGNGAPVAQPATAAEPVPSDNNCSTVPGVPVAADQDV